MSSAALLTPIDRVRTMKPAVSERVSVLAATPPILRSIAHELSTIRSKEAFAVLAAQYERHAHHLEDKGDVPTLAITDGLVTVNETSPLGRVLIVPAPACDENTIGTHIAAALTAGDQISLATFAPIDGLIGLFCEILAGILAVELFTVLAPGSGWEAPGRQSVVVVTPDGAFAHDLPWWKHHSEADGQTDVGELVGFYRRSSTFCVPVRTSPYSGFVS